MSDPLTLLLAWAAGCVLGAVFFGGLWWTVYRAVASKRPALWMLTSLLVRMGTVLAGFYFVSASHWDRLLFCLGGFVMARVLVMRLCGTSEARLSSAAKASHAP